ncbi:MAG: hypothetical protein OXC80_13410 [Gammaproteobacteria bacterium]|nr:hypothetical protein [Gammaproteobacteria bacterium]
MSNLNLGLPEAAPEYVSRIRMKREYYVVDGHQCLVINVLLALEELNWCDVSDPETISGVMQLREHYPED